MSKNKIPEGKSFPASNCKRVLKTRGKAPLNNPQLIDAIVAPIGQLNIMKNIDITNFGIAY